MQISRRTGTDVPSLAAAARSILACPDEVRLVVDGVDDIMAGLDPDGRADHRDRGARLGLVDVDGRPVLSCPPASALAHAAGDGRGALLTLTSGVGPRGSTERDDTLTIAGRLELTRAEECGCCGDARATVLLRPSYVVLTRPAAGAGSDDQARVPLGAFCSPAHQLNRGFLQRAADHANRCHQDELRRAVATTSSTRVGDIVGVQLSGLRPDRVDVRWVDRSGAHERALLFDRPATTSQELGDLLRRELHAGLC